MLTAALERSARNNSAKSHHEYPFFFWHTASKVMQKEISYKWPEERRTFILLPKGCVYSVSLVSLSQLENCIRSVCNKGRECDVVLTRVNTSQNCELDSNCKILKISWFILWNLVSCFHGIYLCTMFISCTEVWENGLWDCWRLCSKHWKSILKFWQKFVP